METELCRALLRRIPLATGLSGETLQSLAAWLVPDGVVRNALLFVEGTPAENFYLIASGRIKLVRYGEDGKEVIVRLAGAGDLLGGSTAWGSPNYPVSTIAVEEAIVLRMSTCRFRRRQDTGSAVRPMGVGKAGVYAPPRK